MEKEAGVEGCGVGVGAGMLGCGWVGDGSPVAGAGAGRFGRWGMVGCGWVDLVVCTVGLRLLSIMGKDSCMVKVGVLIVVIATRTVLLMTMVTDPAAYRECKVDVILAHAVWANENSIGGHRSAWARPVSSNVVSYLYQDAPRKGGELELMVSKR